MKPLKLHLQNVNAFTKILYISFITTFNLNAKISLIIQQNHQYNVSNKHRKNQKKRRDARGVHDAAHQSAEIFFKRHLHGRRRLQGDGVFERRPYEHQPLSRVLQSCNRQMRA